MNTTFFKQISILFLKCENNNTSCHCDDKHYSCLFFSFVLPVFLHRSGFFPLCFFVHVWIPSPHFSFPQSLISPHICLHPISQPLSILNQFVASSAHCMSVTPASKLNAFFTWQNISSFECTSTVRQIPPRSLFVGH